MAKVQRASEKGKYCSEIGCTWSEKINMIKLISSNEELCKIWVKTPSGYVEISWWCANITARNVHKKNISKKIIFMKRERERESVWRKIKRPATCSWLISIIFSSTVENLCRAKNSLIPPLRLPFWEWDRDEIHVNEGPKEAIRRPKLNFYNRQIF